MVTWPVLTLYARVSLPAGIPDISYERVLVPVTADIIILEGLVRKRKLQQIGMLDILVGTYVAAQLASRVVVLWFEGLGKPDLNGILDVIVLPILMYWMTKNVLVSKWHLRRLLYALILASVMIGLSGLYERALGLQESPFPITPYLIGGKLSTRFFDVPQGRAAGLVGNPAIYGAVSGIGVLVSLCCLVHSQQQRTRVVLAATIIILLYGIFASYTRSAWVSVAVALFIAQFFMKDLWKRTLPIYAMGILFLVLGWNALESSPVVASRILNPHNMDFRLAFVPLAWQQFLEKPVLGWGSGALDYFGFTYYQDSSHNIFLTLLVDGGLVLFLSFVVVIIYLFSRALRVYRLLPQFERSVLAAMIGSVMIYLLSGMALELRYFGYFNALFWIVVGVIDKLKDPFAWRNDKPVVAQY
jgi:O-antigen ligase